MKLTNSSQKVLATIAAIAALPIGLCNPANAAERIMPATTVHISTPVHLTATVTSTHIQIPAAVKPMNVVPMSVRIDSLRGEATPHAVSAGSRESSLAGKLATILQNEDQTCRLGSGVRMVILKDAGLIRETDRDLGHLNGQFWNLMGQAIGIDDQLKLDLSLNGGKLTKPEYQMLTSEESMLGQQVKSDYLTNPQIFHTPVNPLNAAVSREGALITQEISQDFGRLHGQFFNLQNSVLGVIQTMRGDAKANGGSITQSEEQSLLSSLLGIQTAMNTDRALSAPGGSFANLHPERAEILGRGANIFSQLWRDYPLIGAAQFSQLVAADLQVRQTEQADAKANGGSLTSQEQIDLNAQETHIQQQLNDDVTGITPVVIPHP